MNLTNNEVWGISNLIISWFEETYDLCDEDEETKEYFDNTAPNLSRAFAKIWQGRLMILGSELCPEREDKKVKRISSGYYALLKISGVLEALQEEHEFRVNRNGVCRIYEL